MQIQVFLVVALKKAHRRRGETMKMTFLKPIVILALIFGCCGVFAAGPGIESAGLFDDILNRFATTAKGWETRMVSYGSWLFWGLTLLSMVWTYGMMALKKADLQEFLAETVRFFATTGFFFWVLKNGPAIATSIINSMRKIASEASGLNNTLSPSGIVDMGFHIVYTVTTNISLWSPVVSIVGLVMAVFILILLASVATELLLMLISGWLLAYAGVFLLGFGGGHWTQDIAINYYKTVLSLAMQIFSMILIVGIGYSFIDSLYSRLSSQITFKELLVMFIASYILWRLIGRVPPLIASVTGGGGGGGGGGGLTVGGAMAAAGVAAAAASTLGSAAMGGISSMAGGASAIKAAFQSAQQSMGGGGEGVSGSAGGLASAMGSAAQFAGDMGMSLAKGAGAVAMEKLGSIKESMQESIGNTTGGKIADAINAQSDASSKGSTDESSGTDNASNSSDSNQESNFDGDSLSGGSQDSGEDTSDMQDEVAAFVNQDKSE
jgi:type IV secretion system protein TrbL